MRAHHNRMAKTRQCQDCTPLVPWPVTMNTVHWLMGLAQTVLDLDHSALNLLPITLPQNALTAKVRRWFGPFGSAAAAGPRDAWAPTDHSFNPSRVALPGGVGCGVVWVWGWGWRGR